MQGGEHSLCLDPKMMSAVCTVNTEIGRKMEAAHVKCNGGNQVGREAYSSYVATCCDLVEWICFCIGRRQKLWSLIYLVL